MPQIIEVPGFGQVEFPDGMSDADISAAIKKSAPVAPSPVGTGTENFLAGAGKAITDLGRGVGQFATNISKSYPIARPELLGLLAKVSPVSQQDVDEAKQRDKPLMNTGAGVAGNITGGLVSTLPMLAAPGINTLTGSTMAGGLLGAAQPVASDESRLLNTGSGVVGGAAGYGLGRAIGKAVTPSSVTLTPAQQRAMGRAVELGAETTPGLRTGSPTLRGLEAGMESFPLTSGPIKGIKDTNQQVLNRAAAKAIGESSDHVTEDVLKSAHKRIGGVFDKTENIGAIPVDDTVQNALAAVEKKYRGLLEGPISDLPVVKDIYSNLGGSISGKQYNDWQSQLGKIARSKFTGAKSDPNAGFALFEVKAALDDAASSVMTGAEKQAFKQAQQQWKNLVMLETGNVVNEQSGNVSGRLLSGVLSRKDKSGFRLGGNSSDLYDMARFSKAFPDIVGDSGTATRAALPMLLGSGALSGMGAGAMTGSAGVGLATALAPLAAGGAARLGQSAYLSQPAQRYLGNSILSPEMQRNIGLLGSGVLAPGLLSQ